MSIPIEDAATILGESVETIQGFQSKGWFPDPIPDGFLDPVIEFRIAMQLAFRRKIDQQRLDAEHD